MEDTISIRLKVIRKNLSLSIPKVIKLLQRNNLNYSAQSLYKWEDGTSIPPMNVLRVLAKIYNCNFSYLADGKIYEFKRVTAIERNILNMYRTDFLFRSISTQIIQYIERKEI